MNTEPGASEWPEPAADGERMQDASIEQLLQEQGA